MHEYKTATNLTEQFAALVALDQIPGKVRDDVLADFYNKWQHEYLVCLPSDTIFDLLVYIFICYKRKRLHTRQNGYKKLNAP